MIRAIIVDDEEKSRKLLRNLLNKYCTNVEVIAIADSAQSGFEAIEQHKPDLLFLDIVMPNENGFQLLQKIKDLNLEVIFTTAFDQYAIKAIRFSALDYLLKPISIDELQAAVQKVEKKLADSDVDGRHNQRLNVLLENNGNQAHQRKIGLPTQSGIHFVTIEDILICKAEGNYSLIFLKEKNAKEIITRTLKEFEELLVEFNFFRVHRSYLINLNHVDEYNRTNQSDDFDGDGGCVMMSNGMRIPVSRDKRKVLLGRFSKPF